MATGLVLRALSGNGLGELSRRMRDFDKVLTRIGVCIPTSAKILDFGCGAGGTVHALRERGYDAVGYDVAGDLSLNKGEPPSPFITIGSRLNLRLPFDDSAFDLGLSDQVFEHVQDQATMWRELHRITRVGGHAMHVIPARYQLIEGHIYVPFGSVSRIDGGTGFGLCWAYAMSFSRP